MEQRESLNRADNDLKGITMRTHKHCQSYRVRIRMKGGQYFDRSFKSKTLTKKWKRDMESAIEHDRYEFTNPAMKHTLAKLVDLYIERVLPSKPNNAENTLRHLLWWKQELGHLLLAQIRPSLIAEKRDELLAGFVRDGKLRFPSTVVRYLSSLSHVFSNDANAGAVGDRPVFVGAFIDAFHEAIFGFSFQRLAAGLSPIVVGEWSTNGPRRETARLGNLAGVAQIAHF